MSDTSLVSDTSYSTNSSFSSTSPPTYYDPADNYDIAEIESGDDTDEEDCPGQEVPSWVSDIRPFIGHQFDNMPYGEIFGPYPSPDLDLIFQTTGKSKFKSRTSSAVWNAAPLKDYENDRDMNDLDFSTLTIEDLSE